MGHLLLSNGNKHILVTGDRFTKWYEAKPLPDQIAVPTANAPVDHWIRRFGCPHSFHSDRGETFQSKLFKQSCNILKWTKLEQHLFIHSHLP